MCALRNNSGAFVVVVASRFSVPELGYLKQVGRPNEQAHDYEQLYRAQNVLIFL
jgi:hypothetical protein